MINYRCPTCISNLNIGEDPKIGLRIICSECGDEFELVWLYPITLGYIEDRGDSMWLGSPSLNDPRLEVF